MTALPRTLTIACWVAMVGTAHAGDYGPAPDPIPPAAKPAPLVPKVQTDDFSCGFLALAAIYESYGINPRVARLRARLGTDVPAIAFVQDSTGTLQPDLLRVLKQDGFRVEIADAKSAEGIRSIREHLEGGQYALALTTTDPEGGLHWIALAGFENGEVVIGDSLQRGLQREDFINFAAGPFQRAILLNPGTPDPETAYGRDHFVGMSEMTITAWRINRALLIATLLLPIPVVFYLWYLWRKRCKNRAATRTEIQA